MRVNAADLGPPDEPHRYPGPPHYTLRRFLWMMFNASRLKCPACGKRDLFLPWRRVRSLQDWFMPLDGCPNCGYPYEREPGYFLMSIFAINYGGSAILGLVIYLVLDFWVKALIWLTLVATILPVLLFSILFAHHAKAIFIAFDLFCDPHRRSEDNGGDQIIESNKPPKPDPESVHTNPVH
jgi:uncharacterized protein (DUF983 family)